MIRRRLGTQGHLWLVLFSQGWLGLAFFLIFLVLALARIRPVPLAQRDHLHVRGGDLPDPAACLRHARATDDDRDDRDRPGGPGTYRHRLRTATVSTPDQRAATRGTHRRRHVSGRRGRGDRTPDRGERRTRRTPRRSPWRLPPRPSTSTPGSAQEQTVRRRTATSPSTPRWRLLLSEQRGLECRARDRHRPSDDPASMVAVTAVTNTHVLEIGVVTPEGRGRRRTRWRTSSARVLPAVCAAVPRPTPRPPAPCASPTSCGRCTRARRLRAPGPPGPVGSRSPDCAISRPGDRRRSCAGRACQAEARPPSRR